MLKPGCKGFELGASGSSMFCVFWTGKCAMVPNNDIISQYELTLPANRVQLVSENTQAVTTRQSSVDFGGEPARAVDGNTDGNYGKGSCTHTKNEKGAWWEVRFRKPRYVDRVVIWNRQDCCAERLSNFVVKAGDTVCKTITGVAGRQTDVPCGQAKADSVVIQLLGTNFLTLCEVQVFASESDQNVQGRVDGYWEKYSRSWPHCKNIEPCLTGNLFKFKQACDNAGERCSGFSFPVDASTPNGGGCLKECGKKEFGGWGKGTHSYWAKKPPGK